MTERLLSITTQIAPPIQTSFTPSASISAHDALPTESLEEEPYTIKCICNFNDDDGNTIYCEKCDTWQHIECFYPGRVEDASREDFDHSCADCKPRQLDRKHATDHQRNQRQNKVTSDGGDKKSKRVPSKSHKKKSKPTDLQVNGYHDHDAPNKNGSPQETHSHHKKTKGHRSNQSVSSQIKRSPPYNARHTHPPSPAHTPPDLPQNFRVHSYSDDFLSLYDDGQGAEPTHNNTFAGLSVTNSMSLWLHDPEKLRQDAGVQQKDEVFQYLKVDSNSLIWPDLRVERKQKTIDDTTLQWRYLITQTPIAQPGWIGELNGLVGFQKDYCSDTENRWHESAHPRPMIFFHPRLPLFIDTRREGSMCRYVRRSCRANSNLETFISNGSDYHFWLISEQPLAANEQITISWDFRFPSNVKSRFLRLLNLVDYDVARCDDSEITEEEYEQLTNMIHLVLSDYGGCACDRGNDCAFARFHRNYHARSHVHSNGVRPKKGRKPKQHISPTSTGHATNSRAPSEAQQEPGEEEDSRSVSGSVRSKPQSRDLTPLHGVGDTNGILTEPSDREKRKLAMLEDSFRKMEQNQQPPRKKKRASDGSNVNSPITSTTHTRPRQRSVAPKTSISHPSASTTNPSRARQYVDASTSRRQSDSPCSGISPTANLPSPHNNPASSRESGQAGSWQVSMADKKNYTESSTQTEVIENAWFNRSTSSRPPQRPIVSLSKRLLKNRHAHQKQEEIVQAAQPHPVAATNGHFNSVINPSPEVAMDIEHPIMEEASKVESVEYTQSRTRSDVSLAPSLEIPPGSTDVNMTDAPSISGNTIRPPPPWANGHKSPELRVQLPLAPTFPTPNMPDPLSAVITPSSAFGSIAQSPSGTAQPTFSPTALNGTTASPLKEKKKTKMSLSDYKARKRPDASSTNRTSSGSSPIRAQPVVNSSLSTSDESKVPTTVLEGSAIVGTPDGQNHEPTSYR
ncbi:hypothetical protein B7494_g7271 [Chlorociboria aeruginascens]|nr:hypothetical protein B7494_g7271 [Chlorociboria aeruginascens]